MSSGGVRKPSNNCQFYPSYYPDFPWFQEPIEEKPKTSAKMTRLLDRKPPELPIPPMPSVDEVYPYRYCSAGPSQNERLAEHKVLRECVHTLLDARTDNPTGFSLQNVEQVKEYETTSMTASLRPYRFNKDETEVKKGHLPKAMLYPQFTPRYIRDEFDNGIVDELYPEWKNDTRHKKNLVYKVGHITQK